MAEVAVMTAGPDGAWPVAGAAEWTVFAARGAVLHPRLDGLVQAHGAARPDLDLVYGDEMAAGLLLCKPDFDATLLMAQDYIGLPVAVRGRALAALGGPDLAAGSAQVYDMVLRAMAAGLGIGRIAEVLAVNPPGAGRGSVADRHAAVRRALRDSGCEAVPGLAAGTLEVRRRFDDPPEVTVLVSQGDGPAGLDQTDWAAGRLHVVEAGCADWNRAWRECATEYLVFLDAGLRVQAPGWLRALMSLAADPGMGGVGARLLNPDGTIRHAGMACGAPGPYAFAGLRADAPSYQDWAMVQREWSLVSGEAFATRRSVLEHANGLDPAFGLAAGHADLCLRLRLLGYRIAYTPHAEFVQTGAAPGWGDPAPEERALFLETWQHFAADDPAYHPRLARAVVAPIAATPAAWFD